MATTFQAGPCRIVVDRINVDPAARAAEIAAEFNLPAPVAAPVPVAPRPMTQAETFEEIRRLGFSVRKVDGEIQVKPAGSRWDGPATHFTDHLEDALGTARDMAARAHAAAIDRLRDPVAWNTGRLYTSHGQRMAAQIVDGIGLRRVYFVDVDRAISGWFNVGDAMLRGHLPPLVDGAYLRGEYVATNPVDDSGVVDMLRAYAVEHAPSISSKP